MLNPHMRIVFIIVEGIASLITEIFDAPFFIHIKYLINKKKFLFDLTDFFLHYF